MGTAAKETPGILRFNLGSGVGDQVMCEQEGKSRVASSGARKG